jgi:hypothetical protein
MIHAASENGFVPNVLAMRKSHQVPGDYHHNMNQENYEKWVKEKLVPNLPAKSIVMTDNAPHHNLKINKIPTSNSTKKEMQQWLLKQNIPFADDMLKPTLCRLIKQYKPQEVRYSADEILDTQHSICHTITPT